MPRIVKVTIAESGAVLIHTRDWSLSWEGIPGEPIRHRLGRRSSGYFWAEWLSGMPMLGDEVVGMALDW
jgi:hypothetical protein